MRGSGGNCPCEWQDMTKLSFVFLICLESSLRIRLIYPRIQRVIATITGRIKSLFMAWTDRNNIGPVSTIIVTVYAMNFHPVLMKFNREFEKYTWHICLRVFENRVLRSMFGPERDEVTRERRKLHNEELNDLYSSPYIVRVIKSRRMRWTGHVEVMG